MRIVDVYYRLIRNAKPKPNHSIDRSPLPTFLISSHLIIIFISSEHRDDGEKRTTLSWHSLLSSYQRFPWRGNQSECEDQNSLFPFRSAFGWGGERVNYPEFR